MDAPHALPQCVETLTSSCRVPTGGGCPHERPAAGRPSCPQRLPEAQAILQEGEEWRGEPYAELPADPDVVQQLRSFTSHVLVGGGLVSRACGGHAAGLSLWALCLGPTLR